MTRDTPAEAARRFVDEWLDEWKLRASPHVPEEGLTEEEIDDLVARLAPIFAAAQAADERGLMEVSLDRSHGTGTLRALRERAERAERERDEWHQLYQGEQDRRGAVEADVARLRVLLKATADALEILYREAPNLSDAQRAQGMASLEPVRAALAATRPPARREGGE